jgi:hypothetical protein
MEDIGSIMLYSSGVYPPSFLDGVVPGYIYDVVRKYDGGHRGLGSRERIRFKVRLNRVF